MEDVGEKCQQVIIEANLFQQEEMSQILQIHQRNNQCTQLQALKPNKQKMRKNTEPFCSSDLNFLNEWSGQEQLDIMQIV